MPLQLPRSTRQDPSSPLGSTSSIPIQIASTSPSLDLDNEGDSAMSDAPISSSARSSFGAVDGGGCIGGTSDAPSSSSINRIAARAAGSSSGTSDRLARLPPSLVGPSRTPRTMRSSPFIPKPSAKQREAELFKLSLEQLTTQYERNLRLIESPVALARLPDGGEAARQANVRMRNRLEDLHEARAAADRRHARQAAAQAQAQKEADAADPEAAVEASLKTIQNLSLDRPPVTTTARQIAIEGTSSGRSGLPVLSFEEASELAKTNMHREAERRRNFEQRQDALPRGTGTMLRNSLAMANNSVVGDFFMHADSDDEDDFSVIDELDEEQPGSAAFNTMMRELAEQEEAEAKRDAEEAPIGATGTLVNWSFLE